MNVDTLDFEEILKSHTSTDKLPKVLLDTLYGFYKSYCPALMQNGYSSEQCHKLMLTFLQKLNEQLTNPYSFPIYHRAVREPFDYYNFSHNFIRPLIDIKHSTISGQEQLDTIENALKAKENVIFLANHQTEPDAQIINILLEKSHPLLAEELIYVAGHRVVNDPLAIPLSLGCNLLCIWSKRHIENPPEQKAVKLEHNRRTLVTMQQLLNVGGKAIYVAPSGGRDRPNAAGILDISPFDSTAVETFFLCARKATRPTHIYPMALATYALMPPPDQVLKELGEPRFTRLSPVHMSVGTEIPILDLYNHPADGDRRQQREWRTQQVWQLVRTLYHQIQRL